MSPPALHVLITDRVAGDVTWPERARALRAECGPDLALHLRIRERTGRELHRRAATLVEGARRHGGWCVVNGRLDVALGAGADAVQLGAGALPVSAARRIAGDLAVGASVHAVEEAARAADHGANYLLLGTIYETTTHPGRSGRGTALVEACAGFDVPVVAIGGITRERIPAVLAAGACGVAVVRAVWAAPDPVVAARDLITELKANRS